MIQPSVPESVDRPRILAVDIDGTMLRSDGTLSSRVRRALHEAVDAGVIVVPSTGRPEIVAADIIEATALDQYWVFGNGAVTRHLGRDEVIRGFWIERDVALATMAQLRAELSTVRFAVEFESSLAYEAGFETVVPNVPIVASTANLAAEVAAHDGLIQKMLVFDTSVALEHLYARVGAAGGGRLLPTYSGLNFIELSAEGVTKARALRLLAADLGVEIGDIWAIGDNHNDLDMLRWAGVGCAMGNANVHVKQVADHILPSNDEDGVAVLLEELLDL